MSQEVVVTPQQAALNEKITWAKALQSSNLLPRAYQAQPANLLLAAEYADTLGVPRMAALTGIHVIQGKPSMSADLMLALVRRAGHRIRVSGDSTHADAVLIRSDDPDFEYRTQWTLEKARQAGLIGKTGGNWEHYPAAMLRARAVTEVVRMGASEVLFGAIYAPEELGAHVDESGNPVETVAPQVPQVEAPIDVVDAEIVDAEIVGRDDAVAAQRAAEDAAGMTADDIQGITSLETLRDLWGHFSDEQRMVAADHANALQAAADAIDAAEAEVGQEEGLL